MNSEQNTNSKTLKVTHNAGFFSCATIRLLSVMQYYNEHGELPEVFDCTEQFAFYKKELSENIIPEYYADENKSVHIPSGILNITYEPREVSFSDYSKLILQNTTPFIFRYFMPSQRVRAIIHGYQRDYGIDYSNTCAIFYRGNDKKRESDIVPYVDFIAKAQEVLDRNPDIRFLVQPDETEFLEAFTAAFPDRCFYFSETPHMRRKDSAIFYELPLDKKTEHGAYFMAAVITMSQCEHLITHSGNGGMWAVLYRGHFVNVHQFIVNHVY